MMKRNRASAAIFLVSMIPPVTTIPLRAQQSVGVDFAEVTRAAVEQTVVLPGELRALQEVELRAKVEGFVERIPVDRGTRVARGETIARIRAPELDAQKAQAKAQVATSEAELAEAEAHLAASLSNYERLSKAAETPDVVAGNDLIRAENAAAGDRAHVNALTQSVAASQSALDAVREMTSYLIVGAPFEGIVTERYVHVGALVGPTAGPLVRLEQVSRLRLVTHVSETYTAGDLVGAKVSFAVSAHPAVTFEAEVSRPALSIDRATRTMAVEADVDNADGRLAPGMYAQVSWPLRRAQESLFVPRSAVVENTERVFVIRAAAGGAEWVDVRRGVFQEDRVEVFGELAAGDRIVAHGTDEIRPGAQLTSR